MRPKSIKPRKQRKYNFTAPKNESHKMMSAMLSPNLRASRGFRSLPLKVGDTVTVMRGAHAGKSGKVIKVLPQKQRVHVDKILRGKTDKTEIPVPIHPSNLMITKYITRKRRKTDDYRKMLIQRRVKDEAVRSEVDTEFEEIDEEDLDFEDEESLEADDEVTEVEEDVELVEEDEE